MWPLQSGKQADFLMCMYEQGQSNRAAHGPNFSAPFSVERGTTAGTKLGNIPFLELVCGHVVQAIPQHKSATWQKVHSSHTSVVFGGVHSFCPLEQSSTASKNVRVVSHSTWFWERASKQCSIKGWFTREHSLREICYACMYMYMYVVPCMANGVPGKLSSHRAQMWL